jgi:hypothetical protein
MVIPQHNPQFDDLVGEAWANDFHRTAALAQGRQDPQGQDRGIFFRSCQPPPERERLGYNPPRLDIDLEDENDNMQGSDESTGAPGLSRLPAPPPPPPHVDNQGRDSFDNLPRPPPAPVSSYRPVASSGGKARLDHLPRPPAPPTPAPGLTPVETLIKRLPPAPAYQPVPQPDPRSRDGQLDQGALAEAPYLHAIDAFRRGDDEVGNKVSDRRRSDVPLRGGGSSELASWSPFV